MDQKTNKKDILGHWVVDVHFKNILIGMGCAGDFPAVMGSLSACRTA
jgi:hypothetical protein